jgi:hypothetical protein
MQLLRKLNFECVEKRPEMRIFTIYGRPGTASRQESE